MTERSIDEFAGASAKGSRGRILGSLAPTVGFLLVNRWQGLVPAMVAASIAAIATIVYRWRTGRAVGWLLPIALTYVTARGLAGVLTGSEDVYFGIGVALSALVAVAVGATAFFGRPIASYVLPLFVQYRYIGRNDPRYLRVATHVTIVWALAELAVTAYEAWHLSRSSAEEFVVVRTVIAWPVMAVVIFFLIFYTRWRLDPYEHHLAHRARAT